MHGAHYQPLRVLLAPPEALGVQTTRGARVAAPLLPPPPQPLLALALDVAAMAAGLSLPRVHQKPSLLCVNRIPALTLAAC